MSDTSVRNQSVIRGYDPGNHYDEVFVSPSEVRPHYEAVLSHIADADLDQLTRFVNRLLADRGVEFGGADGHEFRVDPIPRILTAEEWKELSGGLGQRLRALDAFLDDVYGDRRVVTEGIVPEEVITGSEFLELDLAGVQPVTGARISIAGLDIVRNEQGQFFVLEDNVRTPSGMTYSMAASDAVAEVVGYRGPRLGAREQVRTALRTSMEASAPDLAGELVLLTDGPDNSAWYEHQRLAEFADLVLAQPADLRRRGSKVELRDGRRVRAVYRRTGEDTVRDSTGAVGQIADLLLEPVQSGSVGLVNWFGNGVADDKHIYAYVDEFVRFYLGEEPLVRSVPTYDLVDTGRREEVLDRLGELVVKPRGGYGGQGVVVGRTASAEELDDARTAILADPGAWIAQDIISLSTHPTVVNGALQPRHVDLRPFVFYDGTTAVVPPGGLTRVALESGSMVVNSSRNGGAKPTWVLQ